MEASFGALLRQLPETTEVESLLVDVSQTGLASGLEIKKFKPSAEEKKGFYAELPIALEVSGSYHQLATFISGIAALPRIVTISDLKLEPFDKEEEDSAKLKMSATAKTYRYLQEDEQ
jgi:type IV pilus assembly protein PilO